MKTLSWDFPYPSQRMPVFARNVVATSQPLAAQAGLRMLLRGGNAADAAVATAIALTVVEPTSNGIGSDALAMVWDGRGLHGLNASGRSPAAWSPDRFRERGAMPLLGWDAVTVPGAVSAWVEISKRFGELPFEALFEPAIDYARRGYPVSPVISRAWSLAAERYRDFPDFGAAFLPGGSAPRPGEIFSSTDMAHTLEVIATTQGRAFYEGGLAEKIAGHARATGGLMTEQDLASHRADWVEILSVEYQGVHVHELPPNSQGIAALVMLGILTHRDLSSLNPDSAEAFHLQIEAMKLAFADVHRHVSDPLAMKIDCRRLLDPAYLSRRAALIHPEKSQEFTSGLPHEGDTVYLTTADSAGMMVSYIQSNYQGFGSGIVVPGTGIALQNRGACFNLVRGHPNEVAGGKRPFHTIIPAFVTKDGRPVMSFGVMGGPMQPQGHGQLAVRIFCYGQNPQAASDAPRWQVAHGGKLLIEEGAGDAIIGRLSRMGHDITIAPGEMFGGAQLAYCLDDGYCAASDHRKDGQAVGF